VNRTDFVPQQTECSLHLLPRRRGVSHDARPHHSHRMVAWAAPDGISCNAYGGVMLVALNAVNGFTILRQAIPDWWIWVRRIWGGSGVDLG